MSDLKTNLEQILQEKQTKIIPENIKKNVEIFGITGTLEAEINTSDATATSDDILYPKTAYVNGQKITGGIEATYNVLSNIEGNLGNDPIEFMKYIGNKYVLKIMSSGFRVYEITDDNTLIHLDNETLPTNAQYNNFTVSGITGDNDFRIIFTDKSKTNNLYYYRFNIATKKIINVGTFRVFNNSMYINNGFKIAISKNGLRLVEYITQAMSNDTEIQLGNVSTTNITSNRQLYNATYGRECRAIQFLNNDKLINVSFRVLNSQTQIENYQFILNDTYNYSTKHNIRYDYTNLVFNSNFTYCYNDNAIYTVKYENNMYKPDTKVVDIDSSVYTFKGFVSNDYIAFNETLYKIANPLQQIQVYNHAIDTGVVDTAYAGINLTNSVYYYTVVLDIDHQSTSIIESLDTKDGVCWNLSDVGTSEDKVLSGYKYGNYNGIKTGTMPNNGTLNYTPNTTQQTIPAGYTSGGTIAGDSNLIPENIKKDMSIFNVIGTLETGIDTSSDNPITADDVIQGKEGFVNGEKIIGTLPLFPNTRTFTVDNAGVTNNADDSQLTFSTINTLKQTLDSNLNMKFSANYIDIATAISLTADKIKAGETILGIEGTATSGDDVSNYINTQPSESGTIRALIIKTPEIDMINMTNLSYAFESCSNLTSVSLKNTNNAKTMTAMFRYCYALPEIINLDTSNVTSMEEMFYNCDSLVNVSLLNSNKVTTTKNMFRRCMALKSVAMINTNTLITTSYMFGNCKQLESVPLLDMSNVKNMDYMFQYCSSLTEIPNINTTNVKNMCGAFSYCSSLTTIPQLNMNKVTNLSITFENCTNLSDDSLNNILASLLTATSYTSTKTLKYIGLSEEQATTCTTLSNWSACEAAGWTTGY